MISLDEAKRHLRVDHDQDDEDIAKKLMLAKAVIADYIGFSIDMPPREDFTSEDAYFATLEKTNNQSAVIDAATFLALGELYANRESFADPLSPTVKLLLERLRVPGFA